MIDNKDVNEVYSDKESAYQHTNANNKVGSKLFCIIITACVTFALTLVMVSFFNGGTVFFSKSVYGDINKYLLVAEVGKLIQEEYYVDAPTEDELAVAAAKGMVSSLQDPYAQYFTAEEFEEYRQDINGSYSGVGVRVYAPTEDGALVSAVFENSPAASAGLKEKDIIVDINGTDVRGMENEAFLKLLDGEDGDKLTITVMRDGESLEFVVTIGKVIVTNVHSTMYDDNVGYIRIDMFADTVPAEFQTAIDSLTAEGMKSLIIDLRNNPGGSLNAVNEVADILLDSGMIVYVGKSLDDEHVQEYAAEKGGVSVPMVVLVNENSASASEILAAALKENDVATVVGMVTYGKGIVQTYMYVESTKGYLKLTTDRYFTPDGNYIHEKGVLPDIICEMPEGLTDIDIAELDFAADVQLQTAIDCAIAAAKG